MSAAPCRLLIVEDSPEDREFYRRLLTPGGVPEFDFVETETGEAGLALCRADPPDCVLLDYNLPDLDGLSFLDELKDDGGEVPLPLVMLTGHGNETIAIEAIKRGAQDYLIKGQLTEAGLRRAVHNAMEKVALRRTIDEQRRELERLYDAERKRCGELEDVLGETTYRLRIARSIQQGLLPRCVPALPGYDIAGACCQAGEAGGDYFDYLTMRDGAIGFAIGDASGHGLGPALLMASTRAYVQSLAEVHADPGAVLTSVNRFLGREIADDRFVTLWLARLDPPARSLAYASAGHECYWLDAAGRPKGRLTGTALPLGINSDEVVPTSPTLVLAPGDLVLLLTDGLADTPSPTGERFGLQRALDAVRSNQHRPAAEVVEALFAASRDFLHGVAQEDDSTVVVLKVLSA
jgi:sigma-B regulation protein RsbU (phosphoserine phosphatase)